jgi:hypothetical protein
LDHAQRQEVFDASNEKRNLIASGVLKNVADERCDQQPTERAKHSSNTNHGSYRGRGEHVGGQRVEIRRKSLVCCGSKADQKDGIPHTFHMGNEHNGNDANRADQQRSFPRSIDALACSYE